MNLRNKICVITGATSGIGVETAIELARMGANLVLPCRDMQKGEILKSNILKQTANEKVDLVQCDLASFASISQFCDYFKSNYNQLHILINNAGVWDKKFSQTNDNIETTFAVNHLAPFLMTNLLLDIIIKSAPARIVNVSSDFHRKGTIKFDDLEGRKKFNNFQAYGQSKLANILFTKSLSEKLKDHDITVNCLMPGVVKTNLFDTVNPFIKFFVKFIWISPQKGAETTVYLASSPDVKNITGEYFEKKKIRQSTKESCDMEIAHRLWEVSEDYVKDYFG
jgi:NAD(P)-dependent dehydrogenase (short-subunit alcohol dehydrogenase family)